MLLVIFKKHTIYNTRLSFKKTTNSILTNYNSQNIPIMC